MRNFGRGMWRRVDSYEKTPSFKESQLLAWIEYLKFKQSQTDINLPNEQQQILQPIKSEPISNAFIKNESLNNNVTPNIVSVEKTISFDKMDTIERPIRIDNINMSDKLMSIDEMVTPVEQIVSEEIHEDVTNIETDEMDSDEPVVTPVESIETDEMDTYQVNQDITYDIDEDEPNVTPDEQIDTPVEQIVTDEIQEDDTPVEHPDTIIIPVLNFGEDDTKPKKGRRKNRKN